MSEWRFIAGVLAFYGIIFMFYTISNGALAGFPHANLLVSVPAQPTGNWWVDFLNGTGYTVGLVASFFFVLLIPFSSLSIFTPINWVLLGTTTYLFIKMIRGN